jgi:hypothetical protein
MAAAQAKMRTSKPGKVADTIVKALEAARPKARYIANSDVRPVLILSRLPTWLRDRVLIAMLGLDKTKAA